MCQATKPLKLSKLAILKWIAFCYKIHNFWYDNLMERSFIKRAPLKSINENPIYFVCNNVRK